MQYNLLLGSIFFRDNQVFSWLKAEISISTLTALLTKQCRQIAWEVLTSYRTESKRDLSKGLTQGRALLFLTCRQSLQFPAQLTGLYEADQSTDTDNDVVMGAPSCSSPFCPRLGKFLQSAPKGESCSVPKLHLLWISQGYTAYLE